MSRQCYPLTEYARPQSLPHMFCPGCGCGQVMNYFIHAIADLGMSLDEIVAIGGVGCAARIPVYLKTDTLHGVHGRTLAWATGIKLHKPEIPVVIFAGDGDAGSIGGNHFIQAARRNLDVTFIIVNNLNFAMTGGQVAPTTPLMATTMTTPYGSSEPPFDLCLLAVSSGATYVSRWTTAHGFQTIKSLKKALTHKGFSVVEIISQCPTHFGRYALGSGNPVDLVKWIKERTVMKSKVSNIEEEQKQGRFVLGEFQDISRAVYSGSTVFETGC